MSSEQRVESLRHRKASIEKQLHDEETRPAPDLALVQKLKKEKLSLKDEIERLTEGTAAA